MNSKNLRCGECGHRGLEMRNIHGKWGMAWRDFPKVVVQEDIDLPVCPKCGNVVLPGDSLKKVDMVLEKSVMKLTRELLEQIKKTNDIKFKNLAELMGVTPEYISMLLHERKRPSFQFVQLLKIFLLHPEIIEEISK